MLYLSLGHILSSVTNYPLNIFTYFSGPSLFNKNYLLNSLLGLIFLVNTAGRFGSIAFPRMSCNRVKNEGRRGLDWAMKPYTPLLLTCP